jgi:molybdate transport system ATP-binding protein
MQWDVAIRKKMGQGAHAFGLEMSFRSDAERLVLFGPSGAGKTLTLKAIAGLLRPDDGHIVFGGEAVFDAAQGIDLPARTRRLGYLFQEYALFPHLTVRQNIAFGLDPGLRNPGRGTADLATERWLEALELRPLADRFPDQLSGGQRQRTALARALAAEPRALLLDEPFAAMDVALRGKLRAELAELQARFALPILLITHDAADVEAFADEIVHVEGGRATTSTFPIVQETLMESSARNQFVGIVSRVTAGAVNDEVEITLKGGQRIVAVVTRESTASLGLAVGVEAFALVKASSVFVVADLGTARLSARNQLAGTVARVQPGAVNAEVVIDVGGGVSIAAIVTQASATSLGLAAGTPAIAIFKASSVVVGVMWLDTDSGQARGAGRTT